MLKNDLLLRAIKQQPVERPPVWMMRQAGRYLPEFLELKDKFDFFTRCRNPEIASELTIQPLRRFPLDAAILFSDILVIPQALGIDVELKPNFGPYVPNPIRDYAAVDNILIPEVKNELDYVFEAVQLTKEKLDNSVPLFGFAGSPWTILCYVVQGQGSKTFDLAKKFCFTQPQAAHLLLQKITDTTIAYLRQKIIAGCDLVQLFDSWGGLLSPQDYKTFSWPYLQQIIDGVKDLAPVVVFAKGAWYALDYMKDSGASALGVDWTCSPSMARQLTNNQITLQGNFDPARLYSSPAHIKQQVTEMINQFGVDKYVVNLGHGILQDIPLDNVEAFVAAVVNYKK